MHVLPFEGVYMKDVIYLECTCEFTMLVKVTNMPYELVLRLREEHQL